jgi:hypothetical protein
MAVHVWRSTNGADWVRLPSGPAQSSTAAEQLLPRDIEPAPQARCSWALVPGDRRRRLRRCRLVRYAPAAARQWRRADLSETSLADGGDQRLVAAAPLGDGYVAVGAAGSGGGFQLRSAVSPDGVHWSAGGPLPGQPSCPAAVRPPPLSPAAARSCG